MSEQWEYRVAILGPQGHVGVHTDYLKDAIERRDRNERDGRRVLIFRRPIVGDWQRYDPDDERKDGA